MPCINRKSRNLSLKNLLIISPKPPISQLNPWLHRLISYLSLLQKLFNSNSRFFQLQPRRLNLKRPFKFKPTTFPLKIIYFPNTSSNNFRLIPNMSSFPQILKNTSRRFTIRISFTKLNTKTNQSSSIQS